MRKELEKRAQNAVENAVKAGAKDAWAQSRRSRSVDFQVRDGKLEEVKDSTSRSLSVRLFVDGRYSTHSTTDLRAERIGPWVREAVAMTRALSPDKYRTMPDPALFSGRPELAALDLFDQNVSRITREQRIEMAQRMNAQAAGKNKVISATSGFSDRTSAMAAASSNGFSGSYETTFAGMFTECTMDDGEKRPEDWMGAWGRHVGELPDAEKIGAEALRLARARMGSVKGPTAKTTMVVDRRAAGRLIGRLLGPARAGSVQQQRSFWRGKLGKKMVSKRLTIVDNPLLPRGPSSRPFDGEGIAAKPLSLIDGGVFRNLYVNTYYGNKLGMKPTTGDGSNRVVKLGRRSRDALVSGVKSGVYVTSWLGGNMDSTTGEFSFGVQGHRIAKGRLGAPIGEMNVTGTITDLFSNLLEVGNDPWPYSSTRAPTLVFAKVDFSGA